MYVFDEVDCYDDFTQDKKRKSEKDFCVQSNSAYIKRSLIGLIVLYKLNLCKYNMCSTITL
jgi:hypothetical protein